MYPILPVLGIIACFGLIFTVEKRVLIFFAWYALASVILYFIYGIRNSRLQKGLGSLD
jgi:APA family basic amino acid/polyamine antiporter